MQLTGEMVGGGNEAFSSPSVLFENILAGHKISHLHKT